MEKMKRDKKMRYRWIPAALALCIICCLLPCFGAKAQAHTSEENSLTVYYRYGTEDICLQDLEVRLYYVADMDTDSCTFTAAEPFADLCTPGQMEHLDVAANNAALSEKLQEYVKKNQIQPDLTARTDEKGAASFADIRQGLYLLESDQTGEYETLPGLICIPQKNETGSGWLYQAEVYAKVSHINSGQEITDEAVTPSSDRKGVVQPKTGDTSPLKTLTIAPLVSGAVAFFLIKKKKKKSSCAAKE